MTKSSKFIIIFRNENYSKWLEKKKDEGLKRREIERTKVDYKNKVIEEKEYVKNNKLDEWFKKQASKIEQESYVKKVKSQITQYINKPHMYWKYGLKAAYIKSK